MKSKKKLFPNLKKANMKYQITITIIKLTNLKKKRTYKKKSDKSDFEKKIKYYEITYTNKNYLNTV